MCHFFNNLINFTFCLVLEIFHINLKNNGDYDTNK